MKLVKQGLSLALLGAGLVAIPGLQATAAAPAPQVSGESVVQKIKREAQGRVAVSREPATGKLGFVRAARGGDLMPSVKADSLAGAVNKAGAYLARYSTALGARAGELKQSRVTTSRYGWTVSYEQRYRGVPVFGSTIRVNIDKAGDLTSVNGYAAPGLDLSVTPRLSAAQAAERAIATVRANPPAGEGTGKVDVSGLKAASNTLSVYRLGSTKGERGAAVLAYVVEVSNSKNIRDMVFVDANTGKFVNRYSMVADALERHVIEANGSDDPSTFVEVWAEGDPFPGTLEQPQQDLVSGTGESYWLFKNTFGRDSYDDKGAPMVTVNNDGRISCPNANWNGTTTNYCDGVTGDDTVAHEWGHAYTEYTSNLIYQWQSGAMNESFSDIWGETVDMVNGRQDSNSPLRPVGLCSTHSPGTPAVTVNSPASIAGPCNNVGAAAYGPQLDGTGITADVVIGTDVAEPEDTEGPAGTTTDGCSALNNAAAVAGKIVMVDRGRCGFAVKTQNAQDAGAVAVIIGNREDVTISPVGEGTFTIPTVTIGLTSREEIRAALANAETVNVTMKDASGTRTDSFRWLSGEDDPAFGGAIRDMWTPTCYGDPGKVSDAEYFCGTDDAGGVHSNSGVPNHGYALLVDGGTYNGVEVAGLGLDKAANIFWRTQEAYLAPISDFADLADSLDSACADLVGQPINTVTTEPNAAPVLADQITPADCAAVSAMSQAVELRLDPTTQCDFQPLLKKGAGPVCGKGFKTKTVWKENFERGLKKWKKSQELFFAEGHGYPWRTTTKVPRGHKSRVAFGPDPREAGSCAGDADDVSSRDSIRSQPIRLPGGKMRRLSFQHYMASEPGWDGGNVKISINGAGFKAIPASAYLFNKPNDTLFSLGEGNSNPMAGELAFTGTDGGSLFGSWGKSIVNLNKVGVHRGDKVRLRFDMGRDGCNGSDGWYVDNVKVQVCKPKHKRAALGRRS